MNRLAATLSVLILAGCGSTMVYKSESLSDPLPGIPFYSKRAQYTHQTKWVRRELVVTITVTEKVGPDTRRVARYPAAGPMTVPGVTLAEVDAILEKLLGEAASNAWTFAEASAAAQKVVGSLEPLRKAVAQDELTSNTIGYVMVVGPERLYLNTRVPLIGSANSTYKLSTDGTLTEATANVADDTVKTLLGLLPINAKLSQRWGITKPAGGPVESTAVTQVQVDCSVISKDALFTLRRTPPRDSDTAPLSIDDALTGANQVQLVSRDVTSGAVKEDSQDEKANGGAPTYKIQGTVTVPPAPKQ